MYLSVSLYALGWLINTYAHMPASLRSGLFRQLVCIRMYVLVNVRSGSQRAAALDRLDFRVEIVYSSMYSKLEP